MHGAKNHQKNYVFVWSVEPCGETFGCNCRQHGEWNIVKLLQLSHAMNLTALLGSAYCGEHSSCLSQ
jgi:hypothetical protein